MRFITARNFVIALLCASLVVAQRPVGPRITTTNDPFTPTGASWFGYMTNKSPAVLFGLDPAGSITLDTNGPYPVLKAPGGSPRAVNVPDMVCQPPCNISLATLGYGFWYVSAPDGHTDVNIDTTIILSRLPAPSGPGPCLSTGYALQDGYLYVCDSDMHWGRTKLEKLW